MLLATLTAPALAHWDDDENDGHGPETIQGHCPGPIYKSTKLSGNVLWQDGDPIPCVTLAASNIKLDLDGYFISVAGNSNIRAIAMENVSNVHVEGGGGFVVTAYPADIVPLMPSEICADETGAPCAINAKNSYNVHIRELIIRNLVPGAQFTPTDPPPPGAAFLAGNGTPPICANNGARGGAGIVLSNGYGAKITTNLIQCFNNGIVVANMNGDGRGGDHLMFNLLLDNANAATPGDPLAFPPVPPTFAGNSVGLQLINASGWLIMRNVLSGNGSDPVAGANSNVVLIGTSARNRFQQNTWGNNVGPGVQVNASATKNTFYRNEVTWNSGGLPNGGPPLYAGGFDIGDQNPVNANKYYKNRCRWQAGPGVPTGHCDPTLN
jgi:hypothetical protein